MNALYSSILLNQMLFHLVPVCEGSMPTLIGKTGESVTLPCHYDIKDIKRLTDMCWGRGKVPWIKCSNTIISTDGEKVTSESDRYRLQSGVQEGDVSLTIINVTENDSGIYGCRVEISGWFKDVKHNFNLTILKGVPESNASLITTKLPVFYSDAQRGKGTTPPVDTGNSDVPVQDQEISQTFNGNVIRIGAVIFIPGLIVIVILVLRSRQEKQRRSAEQLDHSAPTVQIRN